MPREMSRVDQLNAKVKQQLLDSYVRDKMANLVPLMDEEGRFMGDYYDRRTPPEGVKQPDPDRLMAHISYFEQKYPNQNFLKAGRKIPEFNVNDPYESEGLFDSAGNILKAAYPQSLIGEVEETLTGEADLLGLMDEEKLAAWQPTGLENLASAAASFGIDLPVFMGIEAISPVKGAATGARVAKLARGLGKARKFAIGAGKLAEKSARTAYTLGTYEGAKGFFGAINDGNFENALQAAGKSGLHGLVLGSLLPLLPAAIPAGKGFLKYASTTGKIGAEAVTLGTISPFLEGRVPTGEDYAGAAGFLAMLRMGGGALKMTSKQYERLAGKYEGDLKKGDNPQASFIAIANRLMKRSPEFNDKISEKIRTAEPETEIGTLRDLLTSERIQKLYEPALDLRIKVTDKLPEGVPEDAVVTGWLGKDPVDGIVKGFIYAPYRSQGLLTTLHEAGHLLRQAKGRRTTTEEGKEMPEAELSTDLLSAEAIAPGDRLLKKVIRKIHEREETKLELLPKGAKKPKEIKTIRTDDGDAVVGVYQTGKKKHVWTILGVDAEAEAAARIVVETARKAPEGMNVYISPALKKTEYFKSLQRKGYISAKKRGKYFKVDKVGPRPRLGVPEGGKAGSQKSTKPAGESTITERLVGKRAEAKGKKEKPERLGMPEGKKATKQKGSIEPAEKMTIDERLRKRAEAKGKKEKPERLGMPEGKKATKQKGSIEPAEKMTIDERLRKKAEAKKQGKPERLGISEGGRATKGRSGKSEGESTINDRLAGVKKKKEAVAEAVKETTKAKTKAKPTQKTKKAKKPVKSKKKAPKKEAERPPLPPPTKESVIKEGLVVKFLPKNDMNRVHGAQRNPATSRIESFVTNEKGEITHVKLKNGSQLKYDDVEIPAQTMNQNLANYEFRKRYPTSKEYGKMTRQATSAKKLLQDNISLFGTRSSLLKAESEGVGAGTQGRSMAKGEMDRIAREGVKDRLGIDVIDNVELAKAYPKLKKFVESKPKDFEEWLKKHPRKVEDDSDIPFRKEKVVEQTDLLGESKRIKIKEKIKELPQIGLFPTKAEVPGEKIKGLGKDVDGNIRQADLLKKGKIDKGKLPEDQEEIPFRVLRLEHDTVFKQAGKLHPKAYDRVKKVLGDSRFLDWIKQAKNRLHDELSKVFTKKMLRMDEEAALGTGTDMTYLRENTIIGTMERAPYEFGKAKKAKDAKARLETKLQRQGKGDAKIREWLNEKIKQIQEFMPDFSPRKNYIPQRVQEKVRENLYRDLDKVYEKLKDIDNPTEAKIREALGGASKETREIIDFIHKSHKKLSQGRITRDIQKIGEKIKGYEKPIGRGSQVSTLGDIIATVKQDLYSQMVGEPMYLKHRKFNYPDKYLENDIRVLMTDYAVTINRWLASQKAWGKNLKGFTELYEKLMRSNPEEGEIVSKLMQMWSGKYEIIHGIKNPRARKFVDFVQGWQLATKIGMGAATWLNVFQPFISILPDLGVYHLVRGGVDLMNPAHRRFIGKSGATLREAILAVAGHKPGGIMGRFADQMTEVSLFQPINRALQMLSASSAHSALRSYYRLSGGTGRKAQWARDRLKDFGIDANKPLTDETLLKAMYRFATDSQLQRNIFNEPLMFNDPKWRPFFLFKRFGYRQAALMKDITIREIKRGNYMPAIRLAAAGFGAGAVSVWGLNTIKQYLSGEAHYRKDDTWYNYMAENVAALGALGMFGDILAVDRMSRIVDSFEFIISPVHVSDVNRMMTGWYTFLRDYEKYDDLFYSLKRNSLSMLPPLGSFVNKAGRRLLPDSKKDAQLKFRKGEEKKQIFKLIVDGKGSAAAGRVRSWNKNYPEKPFRMHELSTSAFHKWVERRIKSYATGVAEEKTTEHRQAAKSKKKELREKIKAGGLREFRLSKGKK